MNIIMSYEFRIGASDNNNCDFTIWISFYSFDFVVVVFNISKIRINCASKTFKHFLKMYYKCYRQLVTDFEMYWNSSMFHFATSQIRLLTFILHSCLVFFVGFFITVRSSAVSAGVSRWSETLSCLHRCEELQHIWLVFSGSSVRTFWLLTFVRMIPKIIRISLTALVNARFFP